MNDLFPFERYRIYQINTQENNDNPTTRVAIILSPQEDRDERLAFINKVMSAAKLDRSDYVFVSDASEYTSDYLMWFQDERPESIDHEPYHFGDLDDQKVLWGHSLSSIMADQKLKRQLWEALKSEFLAS